MSKKPKTPDVAAVWKEVRKASNELASLRVSVAAVKNDAEKNTRSLEISDARINRVWQELEGLQAEVSPRGFTTSTSNSVTERLDKLEAATKSLQNAEIDAQGIGEQIGDLEVRVANLEPLHAAVSMLEAKVAALTEPRSQSERMAKQADGMVQELQSSRISVLNRKLNTLRSVVTVLVIVQAFTTIAGLAWVLGGGH